MNNFFLLNEAIDVSDFDVFKLGMSKLVAINKQENDDFLKHESVYNLDILNVLYSTYGYEEQVISIFLEQLSPVQDYIDDELAFELYFPNENNAFLGIDFSSTSVSLPRQIVDIDAYEAWKYYTMSTFNKLLSVLGTCHFSNNFEKDFSALSTDLQNAILQDFIRAKDRQLPTPFYPDTSLIKDVSPNNYTHKVMELRIYHPVAVRVYFNESQGKVFLSSIEHKANPNQNTDINNAHRIITTLIRDSQ
ncbi:MAG: hypothetical protein IT219_04055 [Bacteroidales bacterium]|nr:hypothetical protein [Bacteroidales bacterium]